MLEVLNRKSVFYQTDPHPRRGRDKRCHNWQEILTERSRQGSCQGAAPLPSRMSPSRKPDTK